MFIKPSIDAACRKRRNVARQRDKVCEKRQRQGKCPGLKCLACRGVECRTFRYYAGMMAR